MYIRGDATYAEAVTLSAAQAASLYGGLTCPGDAGGGWTYAGVGMRAVVAPQSTGVALSITGTTAALTIEDVEFDALAANASQLGSSSIGRSGATG